VTTAEMEWSSRIRGGAEDHAAAPVQSDAHISDPVRGNARKWIASGIFVFVLALYILTSPGRIDIIDGQARFDVAYNWVTLGSPVIRDPWIKPFMGVQGRGGAAYSFYGVPASLFSMPLVWAGNHFGKSGILASQFLFSLTSSFFGAGIAVVLFLFYLELGVSLRSATGWTMVSSFATMIWPVSNSTFDNAQHAFFAIAATFLAYLSQRRQAVAYAWAGGAMAGILILYQEYFLLIIPALGLATLNWKGLVHTVPSGAQALQVSAGDRLLHPWRALHAFLREAWNEPGEARSSCVRYFVFLTAAGCGLLLSFAYNDLRFGSWFYNGKIRLATERGYHVFGNPLAGFLTLLVSPGKSVFLYSPPLVLGVLGIRRLWRRTPELATALCFVTGLLVLFISCISFAGGDWCWGPRYLTLLLPLWALAFPFALGVNVRRELAVAFIGVGFLVQILALSVENQRFFFERGLNDLFWAEDSWAYFKRSALFARVGETVSLGQGAPATAQLFNSIPIPDWSTYAILGPPANVPRALTPQWIRSYKIFFVPRPWPLWMSWLPPSLRPVELATCLLALFGMAGVGLGLIYKGFRKGACV